MIPTSNRIDCGHWPPLPTWMCFKPSFMVASEQPSTRTGWADIDACGASCFLPCKRAFPPVDCHAFCVMHPSCHLFVITITTSTHLSIFHFPYQRESARRYDSLTVQPPSRLRSLRHIPSSALHGGIPTVGEFRGSDCEYYLCPSSIEKGVQPIPLHVVYQFYWSRHVMSFV